jgi:parallel beta-helix repeat protein
MLTPGSTLYVKQGTYAEALHNTIPGGRSWSQAVTIAAYPGHSVVVKPPRGAKFALYFRGADRAYITISNLTIDAANVTYEAVKITGNGTPATAAHNIHLVDSEIKNSPIAGVYTSKFAHSNKFVRLSVHGHGQVDAKGTRKGHGFYLASENNLVDQCTIYDNSYYGVHAVKVDGLAHGNVVSNNTITRNWGGVVLGRGSRHVVYNNLIYRNDTMGLRVDYAADAVNVLNNTVYRNGSLGIYIGTGSTRAEVVNNIVHANKPDIRDVGHSTKLSHNITVDPKFVDTGRPDFRLRSDSSAIDRGVKITIVSKDVAGTPRPQGSSHDIGAFEATPAAPPAPKPAPTPASAPAQKPVATPAPDRGTAPIARADVVPSSLKLGSAKVQAGSTTPLRVTVANGGRATARSVAVTISFASDATMSQAANINVGTLLAGASGTVATTLTAPIRTGTYTVLATATTPDPESSTANNTASTTLGVLNGPALTASDCDYYASPDGTGSGESPATAFRINDFWSVAAPGETLCLVSGTMASPKVYQGAANMISPGLVAPGKSGTNGSPITIKAMVDGGVLLDGQFARMPVYFDNNDWFVIEGINARNGTSAVVRLYNGSDRNVIRRGVFWDADIRRASHLISNWNAGINGPNLVEDVAVFGTFEVGLHHYGNVGGLTLRRVWCRWEGSTTNAGAHQCVNSGYNNTENHISENLLLTGTRKSMPASFAVTGAGGDIASFNPVCPSAIYPALQTDGQATEFCPGPLYRLRHAETQTINSRLYGSLMYLGASSSGGVGDNMVAIPTPGSSVAGFHVRHAMVFVHPSNPRFRNIHGFWFGTGRSDVSASNITAVRGVADLVDSSWAISGHVQGTDLGAIKNLGADPWTGTKGANLCYRWVNGAATTTPLWPWPMNDRIKAATAMAGSYSGPCQHCAGGRAPRIETDVTADIEMLLGPIPEICRR